MGDGLGEWWGRLCVVLRKASEQEREEGEEGQEGSGENVGRGPRAEGRAVDRPVAQTQSARRDKTANAQPKGGDDRGIPRVRCGQFFWLKFARKKQTAALLIHPRPKSRLTTATATI